MTIIIAVIATGMYAARAIRPIMSAPGVGANVLSSGGEMIMLDTLIIVVLLPMTPFSSVTVKVTW